MYTPLDAPDSPDAAKRTASHRPHLLLLLLLSLLVGIALWPQPLPAAPRSALQTYKVGQTSLPVLPEYHPQVYAKLGFDHIYVIHDPAFPDRLTRSAQLLQMLKISAEFVPQVNDPWHTYFGVLHNMAHAGHQSALVLDDSLDIEITVKKTMRAVHSHLPPDWDMLFPGHCGAFEYIQPKVDVAFKPLRHANMPICMHAHALSRKGLLTILHHLRDSPARESTALNMSIMRLKENNLLQMFSLDSPIFVPREAHNTKVRLVGNKPPKMSALERLALWQGEAGQRQ
ncbi:hypothetical protein DL89DRAFT_289993 [Linderina pennispora]|uniref:Nucleotide-diphospho-sugar transferase domain-containing protein n=1 Tax=Linderina pennispora TaxID=61395 RepID=A0A1Y1WLI1_9FUNG|nr:uncharacterized protein DL89DRAFT_289993 [Linderina pennispora]ORX74430.1 hypothetical protein DL89DRAFT_289993 [Linderina pennispora]